MLIDDSIYEDPGKDPGHKKHVYKSMFIKACFCYLATLAGAEYLRCVSLQEM